MPAGMERDELALRHKEPERTLVFQILFLACLPVAIFLAIAGRNRAVRSGPA
jgi:hypothetical protein